MKQSICGIIAAGTLCIGEAILAAEVSPVIVKYDHDETVVGADRHATRTLRLRLQATNDAAAAQIAEQPVPYNESMQTLDILEAYTLKANGERIPVTRDAIHTQQRRESPQQSHYNDLRQKVIVYPNVAGGDSIVLTARWRQVEHYIPGHVFFTQSYAPTHPIEEASETIIVPKDYPLHVEHHGGRFETETGRDTITYRWRYSPAVPQDDKPPFIDPDDHGPRLYLSSLRSYEELGRAYAELALSKVVVTPSIQELADDLTAGVSDRREQAQRIYNWVSRNIRYIALSFGDRAIIPNDAASVLEVGYGDCKDHSVLLMALLKAKGIDSEIVLIDSGTKYTLSKVPRMAQFDHVIVYLRAFDLYVDATAGVAPFGTLPFGEYGKPVVHAIRTGDVVRRTPLLQSTTVAVKTDASFDSDGRVNEDSTIEAEGPFSIAFRTSAQAVQSEGVSRYIASRVRNGSTGASGTIDFTDPLVLHPSYVIRSRIKHEPTPNWLSGGASFRMLRPFVRTPYAGDFLMGPLSQRGLSEDDPMACYTGRITEELSFTPPPGRRFASLPDDAAIATANLEFTSRWSMDGDRVIQKTEFTTRIDQPLCTGNVRKETQKVLLQIGNYHGRAVIWLEPERAVAP